MNNYMSRNSHGVILLFWVGERLIVTFGRQVQCRLLDHLMFCPFCMAVAVPFSSLWLSCILQAMEWRGFLPSSHTCCLFLTSSWLPQVACCLVSSGACTKPASSSPCMPFSAYAHVHSLPQAGRTFLPQTFEAMSWALPQSSLTGICFLPGFTCSHG